MLWQWCRAPLNPTKVAVGRWLHLMSRPFSAAQAVTGTAPTSVLTRARAKVRPHSQPCVLAEMFVSCPYGNPISLGLCGSSLDSCLRPQGSLFSILAAAWSAAPARDSGRGICSPCLCRCASPACLQLPEHHRALQNESDHESDTLKPWLALLLGGTEGQQRCYLRIRC